MRIYSLPAKGGRGGQYIPAHFKAPEPKEAPEKLLSDPNRYKIVHNNRVINDKKRHGKNKSRYQFKLHPLSIINHGFSFRINNIKPET